VREARKRPLLPSDGVFFVDARVQQGAWGSGVLLP